VRRNQGVVASPKGVTEKVVVLSRVINNWENTNSAEEVRGGSSRSNQLTTGNERFRRGGVLAEQVVTALNLEAKNEVKRTGHTVLLNPVQRPKATVFERGSEAR